MGTKLTIYNSVDRSVHIRLPNSQYNYKDCFEFVSASATIKSEKWVSANQYHVVHNHYQSSCGREPGVTKADTIPHIFLVAGLKKPGL